MVRLLLVALLMLKLSAAYGATWSAAFGDRELRYNDRIWAPVGEFHAPDDQFIGLFDKSDGSTFVLRLEASEGADQPDDESIESSLEQGIADEKFQARWIGRSTKDVSGVEFTLLRYEITNPRFGEQTLVHAYARMGGEVVILMLVWPRSLPVAADGLPTKHEALLEGLHLGTDG